MPSHTSLLNQTLDNIINACIEQYYKTEYTQAVYAAAYNVTVLLRIQALLKAVMSIKANVIKKAWWLTGIAHGGVDLQAVLDSYKVKRFKPGTSFRKKSLPTVTGEILRAHFFSPANLALPPKGKSRKNAIHYFNVCSE